MTCHTEFVHGNWLAASKFTTCPWDYHSICINIHCHIYNYVIKWTGNIFSKYPQVCYFILVKKPKRILLCTCGPNEQLALIKISVFQSSQKNEGPSLYLWVPSDPKQYLGYDATHWNCCWLPVWTHPSGKCVMGSQCLAPELPMFTGSWIFAGFLQDISVPANPSFQGLRLPFCLRPSVHCISHSQEDSPLFFPAIYSITWCTWYMLDLQLF